MNYNKKKNYAQIKYNKEKIKDKYTMKLNTEKY